LESFLNWFVTVVCRELSRENKAEVMRKLRKLNQEEAEQVVSNMAQTWRKMYDNARMEGLPTGEAKGKAVSSGAVFEQYLNKWQGLTATKAMRLCFYRVMRLLF
jgi:hypothetical protein